MKQNAFEDFSNLGEHVDVAYACRDTKKLLDVIKKEIGTLESTVATLGCTALALSEEKNISTEYATGSPNPRQWFSIPHKRDANPEEYDNIMRSLGVSEDLISKELVRIHPPDFVDWCTELQDKAPIDTDKITSTEFRFRITKKKDIDAP